MELYDANRECTHTGYVWSCKQVLKLPAAPKHLCYLSVGDKGSRSDILALPAWMALLFDTDDGARASEASTNCQTTQCHIPVIAMRTAKLYSPFLDLIHLFSFLTFLQSRQSSLDGGSVCRQGHYLHTGQYKHIINAHRHAYFKRDSNPRSLCSSRRRQFMSYTALPMWWTFNTSTLTVLCSFLGRLNFINAEEMKQTSSTECRSVAARSKAWNKCLHSLEHWNRGFQYHSRHGCLSAPTPV
jgi:hypothetical protein